MPDGRSAHLHQPEQAAVEAGWQDAKEPKVSVLRNSKVSHITQDLHVPTGLPDSAHLQGITFMSIG